MVEDLIKRLRDTVDEEAGHGVRNEAADLLEQQAARLTALESERDALLAAAGKEAVAVAWFDKERNTVRWKDGLVNADFRDGQPFFTAPQASEGKGEHVAYQWKNKVFGNWVFANDIHHAEMMRQHGHETRALVVAAPQAECAPSWHGSHAATPVTTVSVTTQAECAPRDAWQPIESAPKFGEPIDVWGRYGRKSECVFGRPTYAGGLHWIYEAGYDSNGPVFEVVVDPTHWMPPPAAPAAANDKEKQS
jgi:predicted GNAT superfamily acetyltransferase